jgi:hypothetical protein
VPSVLGHVALWFSRVDSDTATQSDKPTQTANIAIVKKRRRIF